MRRKGLRRVEFWLPVNHPIFSFPAGRRSERVRELVDLGLRLEQRLDALRQDVVREIGTLRAEMRALLEKAAAGGSGARSTPAPSDAAKRFLAAFD